MKASKLVKILQGYLEEGIDPEIDILLERVPTDPVDRTFRTQHEDSLETVVISRRYTKGVPDPSAARVKLLGQSFEF